MSTKKKVIISIAVIIWLIVMSFIGLIIFEVYKDFQEEKILKQEVEKMWNLTYNLDVNANVITLNDNLKKLKTKGEYGKVELAFKNYMADLVSNLTAVSKIANDKTIPLMISINNYEEDGPYFIKSRAKIKNYNETLEKSKSELTKYLKEEKIMSYINKKSVGSYYLDLYKELTVKSSNMTDNDVKKINESIDELINTLKDIDDILNFLEKNKNHWDIEENKIYFDSDKLIDEYSKLLLKVA